METLLKIFGAAVVLVFVVTLFSALGAWFTQYFVNHLFTSAVLLYLFGTAKLSLTQAFVLNVVSGILFKSTNINSKS
jgi:ABC-type multidrug transport system fused ATPase/permease subunit